VEPGLKLNLFMANITIYTTPTCAYCKLVKDYFKEEGVEYEEKDVTADTAARDEMIQKSGQMGVPVIMVGDQVVVGFDKDKLAGLIKESGGGDKKTEE